MTYWVFKSDFGKEGVFLSSLPGEGPKDYEYSKGRSLADRHPSGKASAMYYDPTYPERIKLYDFVANLDGVLIANQKVKTILSEFGIKNIEYLPVQLMDHQDKLVTEDYSILNVLGGEDIVDMEASEYRMGSIIKTQIKRIKKLVIDDKSIPDNAHFFRASAKLNQFFISGELKQVFDINNITGYRSIVADGWNGKG